MNSPAVPSSGPRPTVVILRELLDRAAMFQIGEDGYLAYRHWLGEVLVG